MPGEGWRAGVRRLLQEVSIPVKRRESVSVLYRQPGREDAARAAGSDGSRKSEKETGGKAVDGEEEPGSIQV